MSHHDEKYDKKEGDSCGCVEGCSGMSWDAMSKEDKLSHIKSKKEKLTAKLADLEKKEKELSSGASMKVASEK